MRDPSVGADVCGLRCIAVAIERFGGSGRDEGCDDVSKVRHPRSFSSFLVSNSRCIGENLYRLLIAIKDSGTRSKCYKAWVWRCMIRQYKVVVRSDNDAN